MIPPEDYLRAIIEPGCRFLTNLMGREMGDDRARVMLIAIGLQESNLEYRLQVGADGQPMEQYARGFSQFEKGGGVHGVMTHSASKGPAQAVCDRLQIPFDEGRVHTAIAYNDYLSICFARLLLWTDPQALPAIGDQEAAWQLYLRTWRPGKPHPETWPTNYQRAVQTVAAAVAAPAAVPFIMPKPGTLTTKTEGGVTQVDLPEMNRSWRTGSFWISVGSGVLYALILLAPVVEPAMDRFGSSPWLAALPLGLGPVLYAVAREWYRSQRVKYAAQVAAAQAMPS